MGPEVVSAVAQDPNTVRVTFDSPMLNDADLNNPANYSIAAGAGAATVSVTAVTPEAVGNPTYVDLTTGEHTNGKTYTCEVNNVSDSGSTPINPAANSDDYTGIGGLPQLASVERVSSTRLRLHFNEELIKNAALLNPANYALTPITPGAAPLFFTTITPPDGDNFPAYVDIICSEMTDGASYEATVSTSGPTDRALNTIDPGAATVGFTGLGTPPAVANVIAISANRVDVVFDETMKDNADIRDPSNYAWDNGLSTLSVLDVVGDTVQLVTSDQTEGQLYTLTISY